MATPGHPAVDSRKFQRRASLAVFNKTPSTPPGRVRTGDERIFFSSFNGTTWAPQQLVSGVGTSPDLIVRELVDLVRPDRGTSRGFQNRPS